jgi:3-methyladenine DNA glycosylase AlkC
MAEPLKNLLDARAIRAASHHLRRAWPDFDAATFEHLAATGLAALEFKARAMHIADALESTLPDEFEHAAAVIEASLAPPRPEPLGASTTSDDGGIAGWVLWSVGEFVVRRGMAQPARALTVLHALTQRFTAEWAIRPFVVAHPELCFATLARWTSDASPHVRRLVSEGSRPRLPWGLQLKSLIADPSPSLPLLAALQDDPSEYVRRSVANHLNDIAKDHPTLVADWLERHLPDASVERRALLRHASRTLIKRGHARVLHAFGVGAALRGTASLQLAPRRLALGDSLTLEVQLRSTARAPQLLLLDYVVHHVKATGGSAPKVFKGWSLELQPGETRALRKTHAVRPITTRRYFAGAHRVELLVNGVVSAQADFVLVVSP